MKKQLIPLLAMSIISLIIAVIMLIIGIWIISAEQQLSELANSKDVVSALFGIFGAVALALLSVIIIIIFAVAALLGSFGMVSALKNGRFSLVCIVLGSIGTLLSLTGVPELLESITNEFKPIYLLPLVYFGGYTVCAVMALVHRRKTKQEEKANQQLPIET